MYVVVAGGPCQGPGSGVNKLVGSEPVGVRHAMPAPSANSRAVLAVCGAEVAGWVVFDRKPFEPGNAANCQRCSQLVMWVESWVAVQRRTSPSPVELTSAGQRAD